MTLIPFLYVGIKMMKRFSFSLLAGFLAILGAGAQPFDAAKCYTIATPQGLVLDAQQSVLSDAEWPKALSISY